MADLPDKFDQYSSVHGQEDALERLRRSEEKLQLIWMGKSSARLVSIFG